ncbi:c-type cytochrome [Variovorax sp. RTB1]|uniref:c-type cytochrome n=1 Tax=Variovorax sp. RTB1 TaxID=3048631 RepID=UPI002B23A20D|nr:c-type cytochrome [Variovorax sp. RTB1]
MYAPDGGRSRFALRGSLSFVVGMWVSLAAPSALAQPDRIAQGEKIATGGTTQGAPACAGCHGAKGEGNADFPRLAGAGQAYLQAQLDAFASGARKNSIMQQFAQKLTPDERAAVVAYYSQLPAPGTAKPAAQVATPAELGAWLATRGRWTDQLPACAQCHGADGGGVGSQFPPLAGLSSNYIQEQLKAWKTDFRPPGPLGLMPAVAAKLSDADAAAVAQYYAALLTAIPAPAPQGAVNAAPKK